MWPALNYTNIGLQFPFPCQCPLLGHAFYESASLKNTFPERDLLCVSLEECREVAAVAEVAFFRDSASPVIPELFDGNFQDYFQGSHDRNRTIKFLLF